MSGKAAEAADDGELYVIGIGASAGGLEAIRELVAGLPLDFPAAYVVIQHLSPTHKSLLTTLIDRETELSVVDVADGAALRRNTIHVTPPNTEVSVADGRLRLHEPTPNLAAPKPSVDRFFISLAEAYGERAVAIVLSGTGSDGAYGLRAVHGAGGITIAQDGKTAKYDGMPVAAVETGCVDLILSPYDIANQLAQILSTPRSDFGQLRVKLDGDNSLADLLQILLAKTRVDFREYKMTTVQRRVERRMVALGVRDQGEYTTFCRSNPTEVEALFKDLMISVTGFFRDSAEFDELRDLVAQWIEKDEQHRFRIWVAGCATGEEVYSIAMVFAEALGGVEHLTKDRVQIFATDIDEGALGVARKGVYPLSAVADIPAHLVSSYFTTTEETIRVRPQLQEVVVFSYHNICQDPPFSHIDLISCRNLLIYFNAALQNKVLARLHYALRPGRLLFLGKAETTTGVEDMFRQAIDNAHIYAKRSLTDTRDPFRGGAARRLGARPEIVAERPALRVGESADRAMFDALVRTFETPALLVGADYQILRVYGDVSDYVSLSDGTRLRLSVDILRGPLAQDARTLIALALRNKARRTGVRRRLDGAAEEVHLEVAPLVGQGVEEAAAVVLFRRSEAPPPPSEEQTKSWGENAAAYIASLEQDLLSNREALQQTVEELETSNEELQSLNEELQSANEELQATNEELETSNEELQSTNEELITVNEELQINSTELTTLNHEFESLLRTIGAPIIFVDSALHITKASSAALSLFNIGRPGSRPHLSQCAVPGGFPNLPELCNEALQLGKTVIREIITEQTAYVMTCAPFADLNGRLSGAMMIFSETPAVAKLSLELRHLFENSPVLFMQRDAAGRILRVSDAAARTLGVSPRAAIGKTLEALLSAESAAAILGNDQAFLADAAETSVADERLLVLATGKRVALSTERVRFVEPSTGDVTIYAASIDQTEIASYNGALSELLTVTEGVDEDYRSRLLAFLKTGSQYFGLEAGLVAADQGQSLSVEFLLASSQSSLQSGAAIQSEQLIGRPLHAIDGVVAWPDPRSGHPPWEPPTGLARRFIAAPLRCDGAIYGLLCFLSERGSAATPFSPQQIAFMRVLASWVSYKLERKLQLTRAQKGERRLRAMIQALPGRVLLKGEQGETILGERAAAGAVGAIFDRPDDAAILQSGRPSLGVVERRDAPGGVAVSRVDRIPIEHDDGSRNLLVLLTDLSDLAAKERALQRLSDELALRAREFSDLYRRTPVMMHSIDAAGVIHSVSDLWLQRLGYEREEVEGRSSVSFLTEESRERARGVLDAFWRDGSCADIDYDMIAKSGDIVPVRLSAVAVDDGAGGKRSLAVITERAAASGLTGADAPQIGD